jgi:hypothetical protein
MNPPGEKCNELASKGAMTGVLLSIGDLFTAEAQKLEGLEFEET